MALILLECPKNCLEYLTTLNDPCKLFTVVHQATDIVAAIFHYFLFVLILLYI